MWSFKVFFSHSEPHFACIGAPVCHIVTLHPFPLQVTCWVCLMTTPRPVRGCLEIWEDITWWLLSLSVSTRLRLGLPAALSTSQSSLTMDMVGNISGCRPNVLKITHWIRNWAAMSANVDVCHNTVDLLLRLIQRWIKHTVIVSHSNDGFPA